MDNAGHIAYAVAVLHKTVGGSRTITRNPDIWDVTGINFRIELENSEELSQKAMEKRNGSVVQSVQFNYWN